jgi:4-hydroxy-3-methylbut-2-enyl diphosphate reductase
LIETPDEINPADLSGARRVGVTAGASTPNWLIEQVIARLRAIGAEQQD